MNTNMLGEITDEVVPWEVNQQCNLMNAIFSQVVNQRVQELRKEKCCGCKVDHPSQRRHECLMMSEEEGWIGYGLEAAEHVLQQEILWKQFREAIRIMRLPSQTCNQSLSKTLEQSRNHPGTPKGLNVQNKPLRISRYPGLPPLLAERTLKIYS